MTATWIDEDVWEEAMKELEANVPGYTEPCDCGSRSCDCD